MKMPQMTASGHSGVSQAKVGLIKAKQYLTLPAGEDDSRIRRSMDAELLLAKLHFACGNETQPKYKFAALYSGFHSNRRIQQSSAVAYLSEAGLDQLTEKPLLIHSLKIIAELFSLLPFAFEKIPIGLLSGKTVEDREQQLFMETVGHIALLYLQKQDKFQGKQKLNKILLIFL